jgi:hypothetical protein
MVEVKTEEQTTTVSSTAPTQVTKTTKVVTPPVQTEHPQKVFEKKKAIFRFYQVIWFITGIIEVVLAFRIFLRMTGAYPGGFTSLIYALSSPFALPFKGIIKSSSETGPFIEWSTFIAMVVYLLIAFGLVQLFQFIKPVSPQEVEKEVDK